MEKFGEAPKSKPNTIPEGALAAETLRVRNELQRQLATRLFKQNHPDLKIDPNSAEDRNAIMMEWVQSGAAAEFAESEIASGKPEEIRDAIRQINAPNAGETEH